MTFFSIRSLCFGALAVMHFAGSGALAAGDPDVIFLGGNRAYEDGRFSDAERVYRDLFESGNVSEELFYNLGNAVFRQGRPGEAALWYRRSLVMEPRFAEARQNLQTLKNKTGYHEFELKGINAWLSHLSPGEVIAILTAGIWIAMLAIAAAFLLPRLRDWRPLLFITTGIAAAIAIASAWGWHRQGQQVSADDLAIVIANDAAALVGPVPDAEKVVDLPPGSELRILKRSGPWTYVGIPQETRGWVRTEAIAPVLWYSPHAAPDATPGVALVR